MTPLINSGDEWMVGGSQLALLKYAETWSGCLPPRGFFPTLDNMRRSHNNKFLGAQ